MSALPCPIVLAAADIGWLLGILFPLLAFIGWIVNIVNANAQKQQEAQRRAQAGRPRNRQFQGEIDQFLNEVGSGRPPRPQRSDVEIEMVDESREEVEEARRRRAAEARAAKARAKGQKKEQSAQQPQRTTSPQSPGGLRSGPREPLSTLSERHVSSGEDLGRAVRSHVSDYMADRVGEEVSQHLRGTEATGPGNSGRRGEHPLVRLLRDPRGMRQAILLGEILGPPKSRRNGAR
jgi:hypothetical protein